MDTLLTPDDVCRALRIKKSTLYSWTHRQLIPYLKVGGTIRFKEDVIARWLKLRERGIDIAKLETVLRDFDRS